MPAKPRYTPDELRRVGLDPARLPRHVAIIMDGNGRWAGQRDQVRSEGHRQGAGSVRTGVEECCPRGMPGPALLIRTAGEMRISNFLLWQISYAEIYVTQTLWPDFDREELFAALRNYAQRERRFGGLLDLIQPS